MICKNESCLKPFEPKKTKKPYCCPGCSAVQRNREARRKKKKDMKNYCNICKIDLKTNDMRIATCESPSCIRKNKLLMSARGNLKRKPTKTSIAKIPKRVVCRIKPTKELKRELSKKELRERDNKKFAAKLPTGDKKERMIEEFFKKNPEKRLIA